MELLLVGLGAFKLTQLTKEIFPWPLQPWTKSLIALFEAAVLATFVRRDFGDATLLATGGAGLAAVLHTMVRWASAAGDEYRLRVMLRAANPRRELR